MMAVVADLVVVEAEVLVEDLAMVELIGYLLLLLVCLEMYFELD
jgi:hypothetical protein